MKKKINLFRKKNGGFQNITITLPKKLSEKLNWYNNIKKINIVFDRENQKIILTSKIKNIKEIEISDENKIILFSKIVPIFKNEKKYKNKIYITEKISIPIIIAKYLTNNFEKLEIKMEISNDNLILEEINE